MTSTAKKGARPSGHLEATIDIRYALIPYRDNTTGEIEYIWNLQPSANAKVPQLIQSRAGNWAGPVTDVDVISDPLHVPKPGDRMLVPMTELRARQVAEIVVSQTEDCRPPLTERTRDRMREMFATREDAIAHAVLHGMAGGYDLVEITGGWIDRHLEEIHAEAAEFRFATEPFAAIPSPGNTNTNTAADEDTEAFIEMVKGSMPAYLAADAAVHRWEKRPDIQALKAAGAKPRVELQFVSRSGAKVSAGEWKDAVERKSNTHIATHVVFSDEASACEIAVHTSWLGIHGGDGMVYVTFASVHIDNDPRPMSTHDIAWSRTEDEARAAHALARKQGAELNHPTLRVALGLAAGKNVGSLTPEQRLEHVREAIDVFVSRQRARAKGPAS